MCDTLVSLTEHGVLFAKNSDRDPNEAQILDWQPAADHPSNGRLRCTWIEIPQVAHTHAVLLSRPWWMWGAEIGTNEHGVTIGNEAVFTRSRKGETALLGMDLLRLGLERGASAAAAVEVIVGLLEAHGQGGSCSHDHPKLSYHNSFIVADAEGAIVLETAGRAWATEVVTGRGRSISNGLTIPAFARAHAEPVHGLVTACARRRERTQASADRATDVSDLFAALRDHGHGPSPEWSIVNGALDAPCAHAGGKVAATQTTASWVGDLRGTPQHWATATSAPCTSIFKPVTVDDPRPVEGHATNRADPSVGWWRHEHLHRLTLRDHGASLARYGAARDLVEAGWLTAPPSTEDAFAEAERLEARWTADLAGAALPDRRPRWLQRMWSGYDADAGFAADLIIPTEAVG